MPIIFPMILYLPALTISFILSAILRSDSNPDQDPDSDSDSKSVLIWLSSFAGRPVSNSREERHLNLKS